VKKKPSRKKITDQIRTFLAATPVLCEESLDQLRQSAKNLENDPEFQTTCLTGQIVEHILQAMDEEDITKSQLANRLKLPLKDLNNLLHEEAPLSLEILVKIAMALDRRVEIHLVPKNP
jgi:plasmid maintenance system antidote protein VapI